MDGQFIRFAGMHWRPAEALASPKQSPSGLALIRRSIRAQRPGPRLLKEHHRRKTGSRKRGVGNKRVPINGDGTPPALWSCCCPSAANGRRREKTFQTVPHAIGASRSSVYVHSALPVISFNRIGR